MLEVEVFGSHLLAGPLIRCRVERLCALALASAGISDGHLAIEFVEAERIARLNGEHRGKEGATDVLSFPIDGADPAYNQLNRDDTTAARHFAVAEDSAAGEARVPRELGDIVICPACTSDVDEAIVHGALHLVGMDHETDDGDMLVVQAEILRWAGG